LRNFINFIGHDIGKRLVTLSIDHFRRLKAYWTSLDSKYEHIVTIEHTHLFISWKNPFDDIVLNNRNLELLLIDIMKACYILPKVFDLFMAFEFEATSYASL
jgi:hypothetical protein